jgi:RNA-splicing ligase RtcB
MSRHAAIKATKGRAIERELGDRGIVVRSRGRQTLHEEASEAYKDIDKVVEIVHRAGLSKKVARRPKTENWRPETENRRRETGGWKRDKILQTVN